MKWNCKRNDSCYILSLICMQRRRILPNWLPVYVPGARASHWTSEMVVWWSDGNVLSRRRHVIPVRFTVMWHNYTKLGIQRGIRRPQERIQLHSSWWIQWQQWAKWLCHLHICSLSREAKTSKLFMVTNELMSNLLNILKHVIDFLMFYFAPIFPS